MKPEQRMTELINGSNITTGPEADERILGDALEHLGELKQKQSAGPRPNIWRTIMRNKTTKLTAAAAVIVAALIVITQLGGSGVAWAEVAKKVDQALTYTCRVHLRAFAQEDVSVDIEAAVYGSTEHGQKQDVSVDGTFVKHTFFLNAEKVEIDVMPAERTYRRKVLTADDIERRGSDIRETLKNFTQFEYKKLGSRRIDGIEAEGIEVCDPNVCAASFTIESLTAQLWVDVHTNLPVLMEAEIRGTKGEKAILKANKFRWNVDLEPSIFEPNIPDDYTIVE